MMAMPEIQDMQLAFLHGQ